MITYIATLTVDAQVSFKKQIPYYKKCPKYNIEVFEVHCNSIKEASYNTPPPIFCELLQRWSAEA